MAQFKVTNKKEKTSQSTGNPYVSATLTDTEGKEYVGINAFNGEFNDRDIWEGELKQNGNYYNLVSPKQGSENSFKAMQTEKLMDKKADNIAVAQNNKENGIRVASTMSGAVSLAVAQFKSEPNDLRTLEELVEYYRRYLWLEWENVSHLPPFK